MIFHDIESLLKTTDIPNKYVLAQVVAMRSRQLSEFHNRALIDETSGRCINAAVDDIIHGRFQVDITLQIDDEVVRVGESIDAPLEE